MSKKKQLIPKEKTISIEDAQKAIADEKRQRAQRCSERINKVLEEERCDLHFQAQFSSATNEVKVQRVIVSR
jgi:hypothetical protein